MKTYSAKDFHLRIWYVSFVQSFNKSRLTSSIVEPNIIFSNSHLALGMRVLKCEFFEIFWFLTPVWSSFEIDSQNEADLVLTVQILLIVTLTFTLWWVIKTCVKFHWIPPNNDACRVMKSEIIFAFGKYGAHVVRFSIFYIYISYMSKS